MDSPQNNKQPWFRNQTDPHPFKSTHKLIPAGTTNHVSVRSVAVFPWTHQSLNDLWGGNQEEYTPESVERWRAVVDKLSNAFAFCTGDRLSLFAHGKITQVKVQIEHNEESRVMGMGVRCVAWAIKNLFEPVLVFSAISVLYIFDVQQNKTVGSLRGHGGEITSINVDPRFPSLFCTTSRDYTTRIYSLDFFPRQTPNNPKWPLGPKERDCFAGAAQGLDQNEPEGTGIGCCTGVLVGGRSGGHKADVLDAAFHPALPIIATCGLDREVKIWHLPPIERDKLSRDDKPLFSSSNLHASRVHSVTWVSHGVLLTHSDPAFIRRDPDDNTSELYEEPGTMVLWRWLGLDRFFPPDKEPQKTLRPIRADFVESSSFKVIASYSLPIVKTEHKFVPVSPALSFYQSSGHDPVVMFTSGSAIRIVNLSHLKPRQPPSFPEKQDDGEFESQESRPPDIQSVGWELRVSTDDPKEETLRCCEMGPRGDYLVAGGSLGSMWVFVRNRS